MPIYDFRCKACGHKFDMLARMGESGEELTCPVCGAVGATRLLSLIAAPVIEGGTIGWRAPWSGGKGGSKSESAGESGGAACACGDPSGPCNN